MVEPRDETDAGAAEPGSVAEALTEYRRKRDFSRTAEPSGPVIDQESASGTRADTTPDTLIGDEALSRAEDPKQAERPVFVIQKHAASSLHYDLRLEMGGVLKSWAVPKGPSLDPADRRLAVLVEDHPLEYATFEGTIPKGEYGAGTVVVWDSGTYEAEKFNVVGSDGKGGEVIVDLHGRRVSGRYALIQTDGDQWLAHRMKEQPSVDPPPASRLAEFAPMLGTSITVEAPDSVATGRTLEEIAADEGG